MALISLAAACATQPASLGDVMGVYPLRSIDGRPIPTAVYGRIGVDSGSVVLYEGGRAEMVVYSKTCVIQCSEPSADSVTGTWFTEGDGVEIHLEPAMDWPRIARVRGDTIAVRADRGDTYTPTYYFVQPE